jgi:Helix-turn-helix domain
VPIGETLAQARQRAGLTVAQVSEQTRIREAVIEGIEGGDYSACGGDFYARANIRSIAKAVGADSGTLISEYDAHHRARGALSAVSLEELLAPSTPAAQPRRPGRSAVGGLVASGYASVRRRAGSVAAGAPAVPPHRPRGRWLNWIVVLGLLAVVGLGVYSRFSGPRPAAAVPPAAGKIPVTQQPGRPGSPGPGPKLTDAAVTPAPAPKPVRATAPATALAPAAAAPAQTLAPASAVEPGPGGGSAPPAHGAAGVSRTAEGSHGTGGSHAAGGSHAPAPARRPVHRRPLPEPAPRHETARGQAQPGHDQGPPDHHRRRAPAGHHPTGGLPGPRHHTGPERYA